MSREYLFSYYLQSEQQEVHSSPAKKIESVTDYSQLSKDKFDELYNQEVLSLIFLGIKQWSDDHSLLISDIKIYK